MELGGGWRAGWDMHASRTAEALNAYGEDASKQSVDADRGRRCRTNKPYAGKLRAGVGARGCCRCTYALALHA